MSAEFGGGMKLIEAAGTGDLHLVEKLLQAGANPNIKDVIHRGTALQAAASGGYLDIAKLLVLHGAFVNMRSGDVSESALEVAAFAGRIELVKWLIEVGARLELGDQSDRPLTELEQLGESEIVALLASARGALG